MRRGRLWYGRQTGDWGSGSLVWEEAVLASLMGKIRINELARELEVKPARLLEMLPEFGVTDKKTHSSSLEDDLADRLRRHFGFLPPEPEHPAGQVQAPEEAAPIEAVGIEAAPEARRAAARVTGKPAEAAAPVTPREAVPDATAAPAEPAVSREEFLATRAAPQRLRPPRADARRWKRLRRLRRPLVRRPFRPSPCRRRPGPARFSQGRASLSRPPSLNYRGLQYLPRQTHPNGGPCLPLLLRPRPRSGGPRRGLLWRASRWRARSCRRGRTWWPG